MSRFGIFLTGRLGIGTAAGLPFSKAGQQSAGNLSRARGEPFVREFTGRPEGQHPAKGKCELLGQAAQRLLAPGRDQALAGT
jgi:hypothetical protein